MPVPVSILFNHNLKGELIMLTNGGIYITGKCRPIYHFTDFTGQREFYMPYHVGRLFRSRVLPYTK